jgi:hypothetical protein
MILGLDVSTSKTGWCLLNSDGSLHSMGCVTLASGDLFEKSDQLSTALTRILGELEDGVEIVIEEPLLRFARGMSSASTLLTLNRFNGMVTQMCWTSLGTKATHLNVIFARRRLGIKKEKSENVKEVVMRWVAADVPDHPWPTKVVKRGKSAGMTVFDPTCFDVADAYVIARAHHASRVKR